MLVAWLVFPLVLAALCAGLGLLADALSGRRLPGALVAPAGLVAAIILAQLAALAGAGVPLTATLLILLAGLGPLFSLPWRFGRPDPWAVGAALAVFALFAAPVVLSGDPTFATYGEPDDIAGWLALASDDPSGPVLPLAVARQLTGGEVAWHLQPYLAVLGALLTLCVWQIARAVDFDHTGVGSKSTAAPHGGSLSPPTCALLAFLAAAPAIVFGYAGWGGVRELAAATLLALAVALALPPRATPGGETHTTPNRRSLRFTGWAPLALAALALLAVLVPWSGAPGPAIPLAALALAALLAITLALGLGVVSTGRPLALALFAVALLACAAIASANASLAPYDRLGELGEIDGRFAGQGPAILFEEEPFAELFLEDLELAERRPADPDRLDYRELLGYPLLVIPRFPAQSRPPLPYRRAYLGEDYEVWKLPRTATFRLLFHMPIGEPGVPVALPDCSQTVGLGLLALANQLGAAPQDISLIAAAPRRGPRLGATVAVSVDRASDLCGRPWDWIEAIAPAG